MLTPPKRPERCKHRGGACCSQVCWSLDSEAQEAEEGPLRAGPAARPPAHSVHSPLPAQSSGRASPPPPPAAGPFALRGVSGMRRFLHKLFPPPFSFDSEPHPPRQEAWVSSTLHTFHREEHGAKACPGNGREGGQRTVHPRGAGVALWGGHWHGCPGPTRSAFGLRVTDA